MTNWRRGDLALRIREIRVPPCGCPTRQHRGWVGTVSAVDTVYDWKLGNVVALFFEGEPRVIECEDYAHSGYDPTAYVRIPPLTDAERREFLIDLEFENQVLALENRYGRR